MPINDWGCPKCGRVVKDVITRGDIPQAGVKVKCKCGAEMERGIGGSGLAISFKTFGRDNYRSDCERLGMSKAEQHRALDKAHGG